MNIKYSLFNPTGNITALVETKIDVKDQPEIAEEILAKEPLCEQVGYLSSGNEEADIVLRMAGGEFCGNATMSAAASYCINENIAEGTSLTVKVNVLGTGMVPVEVTVQDKGILGKIKMPNPVSLTEVTLDFEGKAYTFPIVHFESISHMISKETMDKELAERAIAKWCRDLSVRGLGIMFLSEDETAIRPLVYVTNPDTLYWESSCASGTTATGVYLFSKNKEKKTLNFSEPGGNLSVTLTDEGDYLLGGKVLPGV